tara:strand:- start:1285 stop:1608 length:324 start_codon:yes stop_codon:yes gene_type:complete
MINLLIRLLPYIAPAIVFADNFYWPWQAKSWKAFVAWPFLVAYTALIWVADMLLAHTLMVPYFGFPKIGEVTISHVLERLYPTGNENAVKLALAINFISPGHIKVVK